MCNEKNDSCLCTIFVVTSDEGEVVCAECGRVVRRNHEETQDTLMWADRSHYEQRIKFKKSIYKRSEHVRDFYNNLQAIKIPNIPSNVYNDVVEKIKELGVPLNHVEPFHIKRALRVLGWSRYYEYVPLLQCHIHKIMGKQFAPTKLPISLVNTHQALYKQVEMVYDKVKPHNRKNFFNLNYLAFKFCSLLGDYEYLHLFRLPRTKSVLQKNEETWEKICHELHWPYEAV